MKQLPNLFTLLNLFFGCLAVIFTLQSGISIMSNADGTQLVYMPEKIWYASLCIGLAGLVDFVDGFVARIFKVCSGFGKQLDSLADLVSFGVAPGMILYQFLRLSFMKQSDGLDIPIVWLLPALILPCAAAFRLAKFNLDTEQQYEFIGVPTPAVGLLIASFPLIYWNADKEIVVSLLLNKWVLYAVVIVLSYLMISRIRIMSLKFRDYTLQNNLSKVILVAAAIITAILLKWMAVPVVFVFYILLSVFDSKKTRREALI